MASSLSARVSAAMSSAQRAKHVPPEPETRAQEGLGLVAQGGQNVADLRRDGDGRGLKVVGHPREPGGHFLHVFEGLRQRRRGDLTKHAGGVESPIDGGRRDRPAGIDQHGVHDRQARRR